MKNANVVAIVAMMALAISTPAQAQFQLPTWSDIENAVKDNVPHIDFNQGGRTHINTPGGPRVTYDPRNGQWQANPGPIITGATREVAGEALAQAIWSSKSQVSWQPIPPDIAQALLRLGVNSGAIARAKYSTNWGATANGTLQQFLLGNGFASAVTLEDIIVFRDGRYVSDLALWAHELKHVEQYSQMGVREFAKRYVVDSGSLENPGYAEQSRVSGLLQSGQMAQTPATPMAPFPAQRPMTYYSYCATPAGTSPVIQGGYPNGAPCSMPSAWGPVGGRVVGFYR